MAFRAAALETRKVADLLRYIAFRKYGKLHIGQHQVRFKPMDPAFRIKGRSLLRMYADLENWKKELVLLNNYEQANWNPVPVMGARWADIELGNGKKADFELVQLISNKELLEEGAR